jgi:peptidoglycan/LPS O-acetylase OafA/YrhL
VFHVANSGLPVWTMPEAITATLLSFKFGVELFFAISGFVILKSLMAARNAGDFLRNRAARIYPVLWAAVFVVIVLSLASGREIPARLDASALAIHSVSNLLALPGVFPLPLFLLPAWTLSFEMGFYVLCAMFLASRHLIGSWVVVPLICAGLLVVAVHPRAAFFLSGMIVTLGFLRGAAIDRLASVPLVWIALFLVAWSLLSSDTAPIIPPLWEWTFERELPLGLVAFLSATLAMQGLAQGSGLLCRLLTTRSMMWLGTISFSLYLWHPIVMAIVKQGMGVTGLVGLLGPWSQAGFFILALIPSLALAHVSQIYLEDRLTQRLRGRRPAAVAV